MFFGNHSSCSGPRIEPRAGARPYSPVIPASPANLLSISQNVAGYWKRGMFVMRPSRNMRTTEGSKYNFYFIFGWANFDPLRSEDQRVSPFLLGSLKRTAGNGKIFDRDAVRNIVSG